MTLHNTLMYMIHRGYVPTYRRERPKTGRNDPCPCGSDKKFKNCCMRKTDK